MDSTFSGTEEISWEISPDLTSIFASFMWRFAQHEIPDEMEKAVNPNWLQHWISKKQENTFGRGYYS